MKIRYLFCLLTIIVLFVGMTSAVSADKGAYDNATLFLSNISNLHDNSLVTINSGAATYSGVQVISANNVTIEASGLVTFIASKHSYFKITGNNVTLQGIEFTNSFGASAITWNGADGHINNCTFTCNKAINGGAITWNGVNGHISNSTFTKNIATSNSGAINWNGANGLIDNCTFVENLATFNGGAITLNNVNCTISNSIFNNCVASTGSAIYIKPMKKNSYTSLTNNDFINYKSNEVNVVNEAPNLNISGGSGARISLKGSDATISSPVTVTILNNKTITTSKGQKNNLTGILTVDGENNTILNIPFQFVINNEVIPTIAEGNVYTATYTKNTYGETIVSGECEKCNNVIYKTGILTIPKENPTIDVQVSNITYGQYLNITITYKPNITGNVTICLNNKGLCYLNCSGSKLTLLIGKLVVGNYNLLVKYSGDENYSNATVFKNFTVEKAIPIITINTKTVKKGEDEPVDIFVTNQYGNPLDGIITLFLDGNEYGNVNVTNGTASLIIQKLDKGNHNITAILNSNKNYNTTINSANIQIKKLSFKDKIKNAWKKVKNFFEKNWVKILIVTAVVVVIVVAIVFTKKVIIPKILLKYQNTIFVDGVELWFVDDPVPLDLIKSATKPYPFF